MQGAQHPWNTQNDTDAAIYETARTPVTAHARMIRARTEMITEQIWRGLHPAPTSGKIRWQEHISFRHLIFFFPSQRYAPSHRYH
ncbi:MAG: hypothetical protein DSY55_05700 [Clostridia bacterium]|nr:MAG: hypothetical protein DSY55_05700 [Clostridia bacterium]